MTTKLGAQVIPGVRAIWDSKSSRYFIKKGDVTIAQIVREPINRHKARFIYKGIKFDRLFIAAKVALNDYEKNTYFKAWEKTGHIF